MLSCLWGQNPMYLLCNKCWKLLIIRRSKRRSWKKAFECLFQTCENWKTYFMAITKKLKLPCVNAPSLHAPLVCPLHFEQCWSWIKFVLLVTELLTIFSETRRTSEVYESNNIRRCSGNPSFSTSPEWQHVRHRIQLKNTPSLSIPWYITTQVCTS